MPAGSEGSYGDWSQIESVKQIRWESLPPNMLDDALPDGSYFTRRGLANLGGQPFGVVATGARTMVVNVYLRNVGQAPVGEPKVLAALQRTGLLARPRPLPGPGLGGSRQPVVAASRRRASGPPSSIRRPTATARRARGMRCCSARDAAHADARAAAPLYRSLHRRQGRWRQRPQPAAWDVQLAALFISLIPTDHRRERCRGRPWTR